MQKVIRDGKVAVLVSCGNGIGWSTECEQKYKEILRHDHRLVEKVESGKAHEITWKWCKKELGVPSVWGGSVSALFIEWVTIGESYTIVERNGDEYLVRHSELELTA